MKIALAVLIPAWFGMALGAAVDQEIPSYWGLWTIFGIGLAVVTTFYIMKHKRSKYYEY
jgi:hypothetical protein